MADEDPEVEETEDPDVENDETEEDADEEPEDPANVLAERDKLRGALKKIKDERTKLRADLAKARESKESEEDDAEARGEMRVKRLAGITALTAEGLSKAQAKVAVRLLDLSDVEVDDEGDADFEDAVEELKELFPGLFGKQSSSQQQRPRPTKVATSDRGGRQSGPSRDKTSDALRKMAGYPSR